MGTTQPIRDPRQLSQFINYYATNQRNYTLIVIGLHTALRISNILTLQWKHDAGLKGTLTDGAKSATFTMDELNIGDKITIAGKEYTIGDKKATVKDAVGKTLLADPTKANEYADGASFSVNDSTYSIAVTNKAITAIKNADGLSAYEDNGIKWAADLTKVPDGTGGTKTVTALTDISKLMAEGDTVKAGNATMKVMSDTDATKGVDSDDSSIITATKAYELINKELTSANNIGTVDKKAAVTTGTAADGKISFSIDKGYATVANTLSFNLHVGADADMTNKINVNIDSMDSASLGVKGLNVKDTTGIAATYAIDAIADAVSKVSAQRSSLGAVQNRLEHTIANVDNVVENTTSAESRIRDTDMAEEMVEYSKNNILAQAGQSMLAQANQSNQGVLSLLQ